jgi:hypothetical protein
MKEKTSVREFLEIAADIEHFFQYAVHDPDNPGEYFVDASPKVELLRLAKQLLRVIATVEPIIVQCDPGAAIFEMQVFHQRGDLEEPVFEPESTMVAATAFGAAPDLLLMLSIAVCHHPNKPQLSTPLDRLECARCSARLRRERMLVEAFAELPHQKTTFSREDLKGMTGIEDDGTIRSYLVQASLPVPEGRGQRQPQLSRRHVIAFLNAVLKSTSTQYHRLARQNLKDLQAGVPNSKSD